MSPVLSIASGTFRAIGCAMLVALCSLPALAVPAIDLRLNVTYTGGNPLAGGNWDLVAKSDVDTHGFSGLRVLLTNINFASAQSTAPRGIVNGTDPAGMSVFVKTFNAGLGFTDITLGQLPIVPAASLPDEQTVFYGIGRFANGAPNYPGKPPLSAFEGPAFTSLTNVVNVPWATTTGGGDWDRAAKLVTGSFPPGVTPGFYSNGGDTSRGNLFLTVGTSTNFGDITDDPIIASTFINTNSLNNGDYNHNGVVDAADYVVWRDTLGLSTPLDADGNSNGIIDSGDYTVWRQNFGLTFPAASAALGGMNVPEPSSALLVVLGGAFAMHCGRRRRAVEIRARRDEQLESGDAAKFFNYLSAVSPEIVPLDARASAAICRFLGRFSHLIKSNEKRSFERRNCLTAPKTANIMPEGSLTEGISSVGDVVGRNDCASGKGFWNSHRGCMGQERKSDGQAARRLSAPS